MSSLKYKLINNQTKEEHLCDKLTIDGFDYYVSNNEQPKIDGELYHCKHKGKGIDVGNGKPSQNLIISTYSSKRNLCSDCKKVIATNNPNIDISKVVDEVEELADEYFKTTSFGSTNKYASYKKFKDGYNKSQETHPFSEKDMIEFAKWCSLEGWKCIDYADYLWDREHQTNWKTTKELLQLWKEQQPKIVYYNE